LEIPGSRIGGLKVVGYGLSVDGCEVTLEATEKNPAATVTFAVICPAKAPNYVPHKLGGGYQPPKPNLLTQTLDGKCRNDRTKILCRNPATGNVSA